MIQAIHGPLISQPSHWVLCFDPVAATRWLARLTPGRFKHVRAFGYVPFLHVWIFLDPAIRGLDIWIAAEGEPADLMAAQWTRGCDVVIMPRGPAANCSIITAASGWCVPVIKRLIGLRSGALRPDALFADCLRNGGKLHGRQLVTTSDQPGADGDGRAADGRRWFRQCRAGNGKLRRSDASRAVGSTGDTGLGADHDGGPAGGPADLHAPAH